ncbi:alkaline phosphatase PafA [Flavimarina sp. Hel_I_48]|uniref:alkaline phosphatase PafA n=1 Tax=Flavimarina sp. Hel_I_48 TaxID=1392488 RepID=UPI0004DF0AE6|nr:alkaline phosphatase PafA [Flavimarina sp. Hel_I_48]
MKKLVLIALILTFIPVARAQKDPSEKPKLVVGIVVDQMRYDYLTRFYAKFDDNGFKRLINDGFSCNNNHFNYMPTLTAPGHASIFTGTTPRTHGIISNDWYNKFEKKSVYCAEDHSVHSVGTETADGEMSPHRMKTTTVSDQNRLHTQMRGKTIGVSLKDRGAILPAGHSANGAYWFQGREEGNFITSSYYMDKLPTWVTSFNSSAKAKSYMRPWKTLLDINTYTESGPDLNVFEGGFEGKKTAVFPYDLGGLNSANGGYDILKVTPYGNSLLVDFALAAIDGEQLGADMDTDFLTVSFSSTDYVGHNFGVNSKEIEDTYIRLDRDLGRLLNALDKKVGAGQYTVFLTADHAGVHVPSYLKSAKIPAGYFDSDAFDQAVQDFVSTAYGRDDLIENISNYQVFFSYKVLEENKIDAEELQKKIAHFALQYEQVNKVYTRAQLEQSGFTSGMEQLVENGFDQKRSGDVFIILDPAVISYGVTGSMHGTGYSYDTHVPLLFYGNGIKQGKTYAKTVIPDIATTISALLGIEFPNGFSGEVLSEVLK